MCDIVYDRPDLIIFDYHDTLAPKQYNDLTFGVNCLFEECDDFLSSLKQKGIHLGIITNYWGVLARAQIKNLHIDYYFDLIWGSEDCWGDDYSTYLKPSQALGKDFIETWQLQVGYKLKDEKKPVVWMIGDAASDIKFAQNNDFLPIGFQNQYAKENGFLNFDSYPDFQEWFEENFLN